jgi:hypothetical protein
MLGAYLLVIVIPLPRINGSISFGKAPIKRVPLNDDVLHQPICHVQL